MASWGGSVHLLGKDVTGWEPHRTARLGLGYVPERRKVFGNLSVADNFKASGGLPRGRAFDQAAERVLELFHLTSVAKRCTLRSV